MISLNSLMEKCDTPDFIGKKKLKKKLKNFGLSFTFTIFISNISLSTTKYKSIEFYKSNNKTCTIINKTVGDEYTFAGHKPHFRHFFPFSRFFLTDNFYRYHEGLSNL